MSHFTVTVIGDDYEVRLAPYCDHGSDTDDFMEFKSCQEEVEENFTNGRVKVRVYSSKWVSYSHDVSNFSSVLYTLPTATFASTFVKTRIDPVLESPPMLRDSIHPEVDFSDQTTFGILSSNRAFRLVKELPNDFWPKSRALRLVKELPNDFWPKNASHIDTEIPFFYIFKDASHMAEDWYNYGKNEPNGGYGYFCNPKGRWDWYQLGGRWTGYLKMRPLSPDQWKPVDTPPFLAMDLDAIFDLYLHRSLGEWQQGGIKEGYSEEQMAEICELIRLRFYPENKLGSQGALRIPAIRPDYTDQCRAGDIDWVGMVADSASNIEKAFVEQMARMKEEGKWPEDGKISLGFMLPKQSYWEHINNVHCASSTHAVLDDTGWHEQGEMSWFASVKDGKLDHDWGALFRSRIENLDPNTLISVVDCHI